MNNLCCDKWLGIIDLTRLEPGLMQGIWQSILWIDSKESDDSQKWIDSETSWKPNCLDMQMQTLEKISTQNGSPKEN